MCLHAIHVSIMYWYICIFDYKSIIILDKYKNNYFGGVIGYNRKGEFIHNYLIRCQKDCNGEISKIVQKLIKSECKVIFQLKDIAMLHLF